MEITKDVEPYFEFCLELENAAARPYLEFVYDDWDHAMAVQRMLGERGLLESSPPFGRVLLKDGEPIAMVSGVPGAELKRLRMRAAFALQKSDLKPDEATQGRVKLAHQAIFIPEESDYYSGKLGTTPASRGTGAGAIMMRLINDEAKEGGFRRAIGEVEVSNAPMLRLMLEKVHWKKVRIARVEDAGSGRSLEYMHIEWPCG